MGIAHKSFPQVVFKETLLSSPLDWRIVLRFFTLKTADSIAAAASPEEERAEK